MTTAIYTHPACKLHEMGEGHPESPGRLLAIEEQFISSGISKLLTHREARPATEHELALVHTRDLINSIKSHVPEKGYFRVDEDTVLNPSSLTAALAAAGAALAATDAVVNGEISNAFCSIRPPGHHAEPNGAMGFCLFNNVALAAKRAMFQHGLERVAIVDFDVHHGNGTEAAFIDDPRVLMVSFFQHPFYPHTGAGTKSEHILNFPVPAQTDGAVIRELVQRHWLPALHKHQPQMVFISAGFDAHLEDSMGEMRLVEADYAWMTAQIMEIARQYSEGRIVSCLEGGYDFSSLGRSAVAHVKVLAGLD